MQCGFRRVLAPARRKSLRHLRQTSLYMTPFLLVEWKGVVAYVAAWDEPTFTNAPAKA